MSAKTIEPAEKSGDELEYERIALMSAEELLSYVLDSPYLLTDSYYRGFHTAIYARAEALGID